MKKLFTYTILVSLLFLSACSIGKDLSHDTAVQNFVHQQKTQSMQKRYMHRPPSPRVKTPNVSREQYLRINENEFLSPISSPLSTLSIDVDTASYTNIVRMIEKQSTLPPKDAVRIEEMINYFNYNYPQPHKDAQDPFTITTELSTAPWNTKNKLMLIGLQAKSIPKEQLPPSNFVALVDVSGSMSGQLELVKQSLKILAKKLDKNDRLSIVSYAFNIGMILRPTPGDKYEEIARAIDSLESNGGTNGEAGIETAYKFAKETYMPEGNNRIIMFTDGDFNIGQTSRDEIEDIVIKELKSGIYLSIVGYGYGNINDAMMEQMADKGNGNYSYVSDILDAKKTFDTELAGTLYTLGKDVKFQVEFNPKVVSGYRLIGYENRLLDAKDFNDDTKDAGEIGVGHSVTALYEIITTDDFVHQEIGSVDTLKYQEVVSIGDGSEVANIKVRYKPESSDTSVLMKQVVPNKEYFTNNLSFSSCVAGFGMKLRDSKFIGTWDYADIIIKAKEAKGDDKKGYRAGFIKLVEKSELLLSL